MRFRRSAPRARRSTLFSANLARGLALALLAACACEASPARTLGEAIAAATIAALERLLAEGADVEARDADGPHAVDLRRAGR